MVAKIKMNRNNIFPLLMPHDEKFAFLSEKMCEYLWHLRYGNLNYKSLKLLKDKNIAFGLPPIAHFDNICEGCIYGKMQTIIFKKILREQNHC